MGTQSTGSLLHWWRRLTTPTERLSREDFLTLRTPPDAWVDTQGAYIGGWFPQCTAKLNTDDARAGSKRFHRWLHLHINTPDWFIACNIVDLSLGSNTSILAMNTHTGECIHNAHSGVLWNHSVEMTDAADEAWDRASGSAIQIHQETGWITFDLCIRGARLEGRARCVYDSPFLQCTPTLPGHGSVQWWGNMRIEHGTLTPHEGATPIPLPKGSLGGYDRTVGHRRPIQNWNWLAVIGHGTRVATGERVEVSILSATDQEGARPRVNAAKNNIWIDGAYTKLPELQFDSLLLNRETRETTPWELTCKDPRGAVHLLFHPRSHRREKRSIPLVFDVDFNQYYGTLSGTLDLQGDRILLKDVFALVEDSLMVM